MRTGCVPLITIFFAKTAVTAASSQWCGSGAGALPSLRPFSLSLGGDLKKDFALHIIPKLPAPSEASAPPQSFPLVVFVRARKNGSSANTPRWRFDFRATPGIASGGVTCAPFFARPRGTGRYFCRFFLCAGCVCFWGRFRGGGRGGFWTSGR